MSKIVDPAPLIARAFAILEEAKSRSIILRLIGALAFHLRCPKFNYIQREVGRFFTDADFMAYFSQMRDVERLFKDMGLEEDRRIKSVPGVRRSIFFDRAQKWHFDIFYDVLEFSHEIDLRGRLELEYPTISLCDLLLEKMQIARINEKDIVDSLMLIREHELAGLGHSGLDADHFARSCKADWGLWRTVTANLAKLDELADRYDVLDADDRSIIRERLHRIRSRIDKEPATLRWRLRSRLGERWKWYRDVDEVR